MGALEPYGVPSGKIPPLRDGMYTPLVNTAMVGPSEVSPDWMYDNANVAFSAALTKPDRVMKYKSALQWYDPSNPDFLQTFDNADIWEAAQEADFQYPINTVITPTEFQISHAPVELKFDPSGNKTAADPMNFTPFALSHEDVQPDSEGPFSVARMLGQQDT